MTDDEQLSVILFFLSLKWLDELKAAPTPLPYGLHQKYRALVPEKTPDDLLDSMSGPYWWGYAEILREFITLLDVMPKIPFEDKKRRVGKTS